MSYGGRIHDALWQVFEDQLSDVDWKRRSKLIDAIVVDTLPIFEREVQIQGARRATDRLHDLIMDDLF